MADCNKHGAFTYRMGFTDGALVVCAFCDRPVKQKKVVAKPVTKKVTTMSESERSKLLARAEQLKQELTALGIMPEVAEVPTHSHDWEDESVNARVRPVRKWAHSYHYASFEPVENGRTLERLMSIAANTMFPLSDWLCSVAKPGERITVTMQW